MKALAGFLGAAVGLLIVAVLGLLVFRHNVGAGSLGKGTGQASPPAPSDSSAPPKPDSAIRAPLSREQQLVADLDRQRTPYYHYLVQNYSDKIQRFWVREEYDTLDLVVNQTDDAALSDLIQRAVAPSAKDYGFRRVRFYSETQDSIHPYQLIAEATPDEVGRWNIFRK